jgi:hypothetical protein
MSELIKRESLIRFSACSRYLTAFAVRDITTDELAAIYAPFKAESDVKQREFKFISKLDSLGLIYIVPQALVEFLPGENAISIELNKRVVIYGDGSATSAPRDEHWTNVMQDTTPLHSTGIDQRAGVYMSHDDVAARVRMLSRDQLNHESVCTLARDRIKWLAWRESELEKANIQLADRNAELVEQIRELHLELSDVRNSLEIETRINTDE